MAEEAYGVAQDLLSSIFRVATELVRGERASLMLRDGDSSEFVISRAVGLADDVMQQVRIRLGEGIAGQVAAEKRPRLVIARGDPEPNRAYKTRSFVSVPIIVNDVARGVLNIADPLDRDFGPEDVTTLETLAGHIAACLQKQDQDALLKVLSETDPLTWLFNRRSFERHLEAEADRSRRSDHLVALLMIDIDSFKRINDRYGHSVGDDALRTIAQAIREAVRLYDVPTRYGGDEFAVILPDADTESAAGVARRIIEKLDAAKLPPPITAGDRITLSIGISTFPRPATTTAALIDTADRAMYAAKAAGGGGVRVWEHELADGSRGSLRTAHGAVEHVPFLAVPSRLATAELQTRVPASVLAEWNALVVGDEGQVITVALPQPSPVAVEAISQAAGRAVFPVYSSAADIEATRRRLGTVPA